MVIYIDLRITVLRKTIELRTRIETPEDHKPPLIPPQVQLNIAHMSQWKNSTYNSCIRSTIRINC